MRSAILIASGLAAFGLAVWARYGLVEPEGIALACMQTPAWHCTLRDLIVASFSRQQLGYVSLAAALLATIPPLRPLAWLGWCAGIAGLVLYCWDFSAPAVVLALLLLARPANASNRHSASQA